MLDLHSLSETDLDRLLTSTKMAIARISDATTPATSDMRNHFKQLVHNIELEILERAIGLKPDKS